MAPKKTVQPNIHGELDQPEVRTVEQFYIGHNWRSNVTPEFLLLLAYIIHVSKKVVFEVLGPREGLLTIRVTLQRLPSSPACSLAGRGYPSLVLSATY